MEGCGFRHTIYPFFRLRASPSSWSLLGPASALARPNRRGAYVHLIGDTSVFPVFLTTRRIGLVASTLLWELFAGRRRFHIRLHNSPAVCLHRRTSSESAKAARSGPFLPSERRLFQVVASRHDNHLVWSRCPSHFQRRMLAVGGFLPQVLRRATETLA